MLLSLIGMGPAELHDLLGPDEPAYRARQLYDAIYRRRVPSTPTSRTSRATSGSASPKWLR